MTFTNDQNKAIDGIFDFLHKPFNPAKFIVGLNGAGGTGKTFITDYIIYNCGYSPSTIACASPTHKACRVFSQAIRGKAVNTIQSTFGFRLDLNLEDFDPQHPQFNPKAKIKIDENTRLLIVDESSMLPAKIVTYIVDKCKKLNVRIIFIGDESQLPPVNEDKSIAFARCAEIFTLKQIVRQETSNPVKELLQIIRDDVTNHTTNCITYIANHKNCINYNEKGEGFTVCGKQKFINYIDICFNNEEYEKNIDMYRIIAYTNDCICKWNKYVRDNIIKDADKTIINKHDLIMSYKTIVDEFMSVIINNSEEYTVKDIVNYTDDKYGFKGYLVKFQMVHGGLITKPLFILDHRDKFTILQYDKVIKNLIADANANVRNKSAKWRAYFDFKKKYLLATTIKNKNGNVIHKRDIDYGFAITSHKSQGSTYENVFIDMNDIIYDRNGKPYNNIDEMLRRIYVACSRASKQVIICYGE